MRVDQPCKVLLSVIVFLTVWSFHPGWASQQVIQYNITSGELNPERPPSPCGSPGAALESGGPTTYGDMLTPEELEQIEIMEMNSPPLPPPGIESTIVFYIPQSAVMLSETPTSKWTYGCSATSAGMIFGYYDRTDFSDMYTGPTNGGVAPLTDLGQGIGATPIPGSCSIIATQNGFDGRTVRGHVDDYWTGYGDPGPDPWEGNWPEHIWEGCTADYMGTNQWKWDYDGGGIDYNTDGSTILFSYNNSNPLYDYVPPSSYGLPQTALCHGLRLFAESRGYTVEENYTQHIDPLYPGGFSFADYMAEINAGHPVMIQVTGHSMVGVGYDEPTQTVYLHDTWDNGTHSMIWGGDYGGMDHLSVTVIHLVTSPQHDPELTSGDVDPDSGDDSTLFTYTVHYYDQDGDSPSDRYVYIDGSSHIMTLYSGSASDGTYRYQSTLPCSPDPHSYYFEFTDGQGGSDRLPDSDTYSGPDMNCNGFYQIVRPADTPINCAAGSEFILPVEYDTSDGNNQLMGIGIRVHFDSSKLDWMDYDSWFTTGLAGRDLTPVPDTSDYDGDPVTDYYLGLAWFDISSQWPNTALPQWLADMRFRMDDTLPEGDTTQINFSCSSKDSDYECQLSPATIVISSCTLDIDGNGQYDALTDGILILRYLFGFRGAVLIDGAVAPDCTRCTAPEIEAYLADCESCCLDIDGNGVADALTDGILILRYLFGFSGATLIDGAVAPDCTRCTAPEIEAYIQGLMP